MKDIVLLSNKPWKHTKYLTQITKKTGCKVTFLCSKLRIDSDIFMLNPHLLYVRLADKEVCRKFSAKEKYDMLQESFPDAEIKLVDLTEEIEVFYNRDNIVIIADMEPDNDLSFEFCKSKSVGTKMYYSAESPHAVQYVVNTFGVDNVLIPRYYLNGCLEYKDYTKLMSILE